MHISAASILPREAKSLLELFYFQTNTSVEDKITQTVLMFREAK